MTMVLRRPWAICRVLVIGAMLLTLLPGLSYAAGASEKGAPADVAGSSEGDPVLSFEDEFADEFADEGPIISDPIEPFNRAMFWFNDRLYFYLLKPVARAYRTVPEGARTSIANFFRNIHSPVRALNALLQLRIKATVEEVWKFSVNSTVGVFGLFDVTKGTGIDGADKDFGQTLGYYGIGQGPYLVLPFLGPSSLRDGVGKVADGYVDPIYVATERTTDVILITGAETINTLSLDKDTYEGIKRDALDPYSFIKNAYGQMRENKVKH